jgi:hypothetical protein
MDVRVDTLAADSGRVTNNLEVMRAQGIRQCRVSLGCSGVANALCPDPHLSVNRIMISFWAGWRGHC